ncbi:MAG TPA: ATP-binding protein [Candidatus Omnitrophota bacterium]|jgi:tRNA(Ile)-lysidine synthase TilS/MesJ|nr:ATP-binding protein [Candidatus Omnitrophota bacterium]HPN55941.1 ATP-binding protein [Candidatus Omnitrophota bacterium]
MSRTGQVISSKIGQAIGDYNLVEEGDKILVAVSGGKDSLTLLHLLEARRGWSPVYFEIKAAHIETDMACSTAVPKSPLEEMFRALGVPYYFRAMKVLDDQARTTCFWCSWNRRKMLFNLAAETGCNKVALGHHKDDIIETILLNLFYKGEVSTMQPRQEMFKGQCVIIRPLCYVEERMTHRFAQESGFPMQTQHCPFGEDTQRRRMKEMICQLQKETPGTNIKTNIFNSVARVNTEYIGLKEEAR